MHLSDEQLQQIEDRLVKALDPYLIMLFGSAVNGNFRAWIAMERKTRFELAALALARRGSTTEPLPHFNLILR